MTADPNKKSPRSFQCREALWRKFEQMARELECSVDYLINDAMKQYARQRGYASTSAAGPLPTEGALPPAARDGRRPSAPPPPPMGTRMASPPPPARGAGGSSLSPLPGPPPGAVTHAASPPPPPHGAHPPPPPHGAPPPPPPHGAPPPPAHGAPPPPPPHGGAPPPPVGMPSLAPGRRPAMAAPPPLGTPSLPPGAPAPLHTLRLPPPQSPPPARPSLPQPPPGRAAPPPSPPGHGPAAGAGQLAIYYAGERFGVTKDRFIIGRGKQSSDLTIKDPNVSRQHAMVELLNGQYYIVDMGSTNGVEYAGQRVQRKVINEGDVFKVCDHELRFSFH